jgi:hypothetical protein
MKKLIFLLAIGTVALMPLSSCKKEVRSTESGGKKVVTLRELMNFYQTTGIKHYAVYGRPTESTVHPGYYMCTGSGPLCHWGLVAESMNQVGFTTGSSTAAGTVLRMEFLDAPLYGAAPFVIVAAPPTFLPANVISFHGFTSGLIIPGAYPVVFDAAHPLGYADLSIVP